MKKIRGLMLALLLLLGCFSTVAYAENSDRVVDNADLLTDAEEASLEEQYTQLRRNISMISQWSRRIR